MAEDPPTSAAVGPPGPGWHLLSAPLPSSDGLPAASSDAMDARAGEAIPPDALALPQDGPLSSSRRDDVDVGGTVKRGSQSGKPRRRGDGAASGGRGAPMRTTSLTALIEGRKPFEWLFSVQCSMHHICIRACGRNRCSMPYVARIMQEYA